MRISTPLLFQQGVGAITSQQADLLHTQQQIASGRRMLTPADDPVAAAQALVVRQSKGENDRFSANIAAAKDALGLNESVLAQITEVLQGARTIAINAGNGALNDADRKSLAVDISSRLTQLAGLANSRDGSGGFLYSGFQTSTEPFSLSGAVMRYNGDQGVRGIDVSPTRNLDISENGSALFEAIANGNGTFATSAAAANTGAGVIAGTAVTNPAAITGDTYRLQFNVAGNVTTYDVLDVTSGTTLSTTNTYTDGSAITVAGMQVTLKGAPAGSDQFTLAPSTPQSVFATLQNLVAALQSPASTAPDKARLANDLTDALQNIEHGLDHVLTARTDVGAKLRELDTLGSGNDDRGVQYQQTLSRLEDLDYNRALSLFSQQQIALEAAQKSFLKTTGLSLFALL